MANALLISMLLSILPISELRGGIIYAIGLGVNPVLAFFADTSANALVVFLIFFFLDNLHKHFLKLKLYENIFNRYIDKMRLKIEDKIGTKKEFWALLLFVAIPSPFTGAYTGSVLAWLFGVKRKKAYLAIILGVVIAGIIVTLSALKFFSLF